MVGHSLKVGTVSLIIVGYYIKPLSDYCQILPGSIALSLSVLFNVITAACHYHGDGDATLYAVNQSENFTSTHCANGKLTYV